MLIPPTLHVTPLQRPKQRSLVWTFVVKIADRIAFDSRWISVKMHDEASARWLDDIVLSLTEAGVKLPRVPVAKWSGNLDDDCWLKEGDFYAHAEHMYGSRGKGGFWYCQTGRGAFPDSMTYFHTAKGGITLRSGVAARWLCETVIAAARTGVLEPYAD